MPASTVTFQVLEGIDKGRVFHGLATPVTIGREEGNTIQLNDERVSRYHLKIQEDNSRLVLTDLDSTNGTKVNGEDIQLRILKFGDMIALGRSVLLFGSREQIAGRLARLRDDNNDGAMTADPEQIQKAANFSSLDFELNWNEECDMQATLHALEPTVGMRRAGDGFSRLGELHQGVQVLPEVSPSVPELEQSPAHSSVWRQERPVLRNQRLHGRAKRHQLVSFSA